MNNIQTDTTDEEVREPEDSDLLPPKQELALRAVISHPTLKEAALSAGVSETTLWRYMQDEHFSRRLRKARREVVSHAVLRLQTAAGDAVGTLHEIMLDKGAGAAPRIAAARTVLNQTMRAMEIEDLRARLEELEQFILRKQEEEKLDRARKEAGEEGR